MVTIIEIGVSGIFVVCGLLTFCSSGVGDVWELGVAVGDGVTVPLAPAE